MPLIRSVIILVVFFGYTGFLQSQTSIPVSDLESPPSPAFSIMGNEPASITKPTTPQGLATQLINGMGSDGLGPGLAVEFAPYWLQSNYNLTFEDYYNVDLATGKPKYGFGQVLVNNLYRTSSFSIGTASVEGTSQGRKLAVGYNVNLLTGSVKGSIYEDAKYVRSAYMELQAASLIPGLINQYVNLSWNEDRVYSKQEATTQIKSRTLALQDTTIQPNFYEDQYTSIVENAVYQDYLDLLEKIEGELLAFDTFRVQWPEGLRGSVIETVIMGFTAEALSTPDRVAAVKKLADIDQIKRGLKMNFSIASLFELPTNNWDYVLYRKWGAWLTIGYEGFEPDNKLTTLFVIRYLGTIMDTLTNNSIDIGLRFVRNYNDFNFSGEILGRYNGVRYETKDINGNDIVALQSEATYRMALMGEYKMSDLITVSATIGKDFNEPFYFGSSPNFLAVIGLYLGVSNVPDLKF